LKGRLSDRARSFQQWQRRDNAVWAVIDHNSEFTGVPEPASVTFLLLGAGPLALRRWRRSVDSFADLSRFKPASIHE
jgi:hypothetical protein